MRPGRLAAAVALVVGMLAHGAAAAPDQVHVSPSPDGRGLVVQWASATALLPGEGAVQWQVDGGPLATAPAEAIGRTFAFGDVPSHTFHYAATLADLEPGATVRYRVDSGGLGGEWTVRALPGPDGPLRLVAFGDVGSDSLEDGDAPDPEGPQFRVQGTALAQDPDAVVLLGDLAYVSTNSGWDRFMRFLEPMAAAVPTVPALGNHEWLNDADRYEQFLQRWALPGDEQNFAVRTGPIRLVVLNSDLVCLSKAPDNALPPEEPCERGRPNPAALSMLDALGPERPGEWTVAAFHHPVWSSGPHGAGEEEQTLAVRALWAPRLEAAGVDVVLTAHDHMYERSHQMAGATVIDRDGAFEPGAGAVYVVAGGGGRPLYEFDGPSPEWSALRAVTHHAVVLDVDAGGLSYRAIDVDGATIDAFTIGAPLETAGDGGADRGKAAPQSDLPAGLAVLASALAVALRRRPRTR